MAKSKRPPGGPIFAVSQDGDVSVFHGGDKHTKRLRALLVGLSDSIGVHCLRRPHLEIGDSTGCSFSYHRLCADSLGLYRVNPGDRNHGFDTASVLLSTIGLFVGLLYHFMAKETYF